MSNNNDFTELDLNTFVKCAAEMKYDDFIFNDLFNSKNAMLSYEIGGPRLDAHLMAEGHFTVDDIQKNTEILDENLTMDQILGICGKFADLQSSRLNGYCVLTNILTSIYIQRNYQIKNPILNLIFRLFSHVSFKVEKFAFDLRFNASFWSYDSKYENYFVKDDESKLKEEFSKLTLPPALQSFIDFEFDLSQFLDDPFKNTINPQFDVPQETNEIGIDKFLHYRDASPTNPPPDQQILDHEQSVKLLHQLVAEINEIQKLFPGEVCLSSLIKSIANWNESGTHVGFSRFVLLNRIVPASPDNKIFNSVTVEQYISNELKPYYVNPKFFKHANFPTFVDAFKTVFNYMMQRLVAPIATSHGFFCDEGARYWQYIQTQGFELHQEAVKDTDIPRCVSKEHQRAASMVFPFWSTQIASQLLLLSHRWAYWSQVYTLRDLHISLYCTHVALKMASLSFSQTRIATGVYRVKDSSKKNQGNMWHRKEAAVIKMIPQKSADEVYSDMLNELFDGLFKVVRMLKNWKCVPDWKEGDYFNEKFVFENRMLSYSKILHFNNQSYEEFQKDMSLELYANRTDIIISEAKKHFQSAKELLSQYVKMTNEKNNEINSILRCIVTNSIFLAKLTPESKVNISYKNHFMYPTFEFIQ